MSKNKFSKILTKLTILGASLGAIWALYSQYKRLIKKETPVESPESEDDDFDFDKIDKDTRDYVSININERQESSSSEKDSI